VRELDHAQATVAQDAGDAQLRQGEVVLGARPTS